MAYPQKPESPTYLIAYAINWKCGALQHRWKCNFQTVVRPCIGSGVPACSVKGAWGTTLNCRRLLGLLTVIQKSLMSEVNQVAMNLIASLPETTHGNKCVSTLTDNFSKLAEAAQLPNKTAVALPKFMFSVNTSFCGVTCLSTVIISISHSFFV